MSPVMWSRWVNIGSMHLSISVVWMGTLPSVPMVNAGVLDGGLADGEAHGSSPGDAGMLDDEFFGRSSRLF